MTPQIYSVTIRATITKTFAVMADSEVEAEEIAHADFTPERDGGEDDYVEDTIGVEAL